MCEGMKCEDIKNTSLKLLFHLFLFCVRYQIMVSQPSLIEYEKEQISALVYRPSIYFLLNKELGMPTE